MAPDFKLQTVSPSRMRARKDRDVHLSLRARGRYKSDQAGVWNEVQEELGDLEAASPTMAMHDALHHRRQDLAAYLDALPYHGVYRLLAENLDIFADGRLGEAGCELLVTWMREQHLRGLWGSANGPGRWWHKRLFSALEDGFAKGAVDRGGGWRG